MKITENFVKKDQVFYGWWVVLAASLNLFFAVGVIYYGFPIFYPSFVESLGFTRMQVTQGFFLGFVLMAALFGLLAGTLIDRVGPRNVINCGIWFVGLALVVMGVMKRLWQYYLLCIMEVAGYVLTGPIPNQVLIANWFRVKRGRAMGYAYLGLGLGGVTATFLIPWLIDRLGWRKALVALGVLILALLVPIGKWVTRSAPRDLGLLPDGSVGDPVAEEGAGPSGVGLRQAIRTRNFWLLVGGTSGTLFTIGTVIEHIIFYLTDQGYSRGDASRVLRGLLISSLVGRVVVGYIADRYDKKNVMAVCYLILALAVPLLYFPEWDASVWAFALLFGFAMGADYMLIPLVTADCFGLGSLGKLLATIIMIYSLGQFLGPVMAGRIFDVTRSYDLAWGAVTASGLLGSFLIYSIRPERN